MAYATTDDLARVGLTAAAMARFTAPTPLEALEGASDLADSYLAQQYALPLKAWGDDLRRAVLSIAVYDLMSAQGMTPHARDENYRLRYLDAIKWLEGVGQGTTVPVGVVDSTTDSSEGGAAVYSDPLRGW